MTSKRKIFVVEDETALLRVLLEWLKTEGYEAFGLSSGQDAAKVIRQKMPDLVLLDLILPGKNGFEIMKELAADPKSREIPVIILTNLEDERERRLAADLGAVDYLIKAENDFETIRKVMERAFAK